jgi:hypothetical protein
MATLKACHYYVRKKQFDKSSLGIKEIIPHKDFEVRDVFAAQYEDLTKGGVDGNTDSSKRSN